MSKIYWEFDFDKDGVQQEFDNAYQGTLWKLVVFDLDKELRNLLKYDNQYKTADEAIEGIRSKLYDLMESWGVQLD